MTNSPDMNKGPRDDRRGNSDAPKHEEHPSSKAFSFFAQQLHATQERAAYQQHVATLVHGMPGLAQRDYLGSTPPLEQAAKALLELPSLDSKTTTLLKNSLRDLGDYHLSHNHPFDTLRMLDMLLELARREHGNHRGEIALLSFERVLALKVVRESQGAGNQELNDSYLQAIKDTRRMALQESGGITNTERGHILVTLGKCLFYAGAWEESAPTLHRCLDFVTDAGTKASAFKMLAQICHYQGEREEALYYIKQVGLIPGWNDPERETLAAQIENGTRDTNAPSLPSALQCINETLTRGFNLLQQEHLIAAQGTIEGALAMIEHQYGRQHYLATTALTLLCKVLSDRAHESVDVGEQRNLYTEARKHALRGFDILKTESIDRERQKQLLGFARDISEALDDHPEAHRLSRMLDSDLF
jgi:tetratricopeptide (TPR) repeat protein